MWETQRGGIWLDLSISPGRPGTGKDCCCKDWRLSEDQWPSLELEAELFLVKLLLMEEILHQLIGGLSHYL